jgi:CheY-like chemotaxis protein
MNGEVSIKKLTCESTPHDDLKKVVSEVLKRVDNFIRKGDLDQAEHCVLQAREIDPKNIYAYAFQERITILKGDAYENQRAIAEKGTGRKPLPTSELIPGNLETKPQQTPHPVCGIIPRDQRASQPKKDSECETARAIEPKSNNVSDLSKDQPTIQKIAMIVPQMSSAQQSETQGKIEDDRNLKIQRMIKIAVDAVRKEAEMKQMEIRARDRKEFERQEQIKIKEATEAARKTEEQRQIDLRMRSEEQLQQKIREALQRKPKVEIAVTVQQQVPEKSAASASDGDYAAPSCSTEFSVNAHRFETLERYRLVLSSVWADGTVSEEETSTLMQLRESLSISSEEHARLEKEVQRETYVEAFKNAWHSGTITPENASVLAELRLRFRISDEEHLAVESKTLQEIQPVKNRPTLLIVDDDERLLKVVSKSLNDAGFITTPVTTSDEAYAYLKQSSPDLILCDVNLETSTMGGFAFYEKVRAFDRLRDTPFIFLSGLTDEALVRTGKELGADDYLSKPVSEETLVATIRGKLRRYHELKERMN